MMRTARAASDRPRRRIGLIWVAVVALLQLFAVVSGIGVPVQPLLSIVFVMTCPGFAILDLDKPGDFASRLVVAVGASISFNVTVATVRLLGLFDWVGSVAVLAVAVVMGSRLVMQRRSKNAIDRTAVTPDLEEAVEFEVPTGAPETSPHSKPAEPMRATWKRRRGESVTSLSETMLSSAKEPEPLAPAAGPSQAERTIEADGWIFVEELPVPYGPVQPDTMWREKESIAATPVAEEPVLDQRHDVGPPPIVASDDRVLGPLEEAIAPRLGDIATSDGSIKVPADDDAEPADLPKAANAEMSAATASTTADEPDLAPASSELALNASNGDEWLPVEAPEWLPVVRPMGPLVNLNSAAVETLITLPGVGTQLAGRLVRFRQDHGPFADLADVLQVSGFGPAKVAGFDGLVSFEESHEEQVGARTMEGES